MNTFEKDKQYIMATYGRFPLCLTHGKGSTVYDDKGKEYTDLGTGIAVNSFGIADCIWAEAVTKQLNTLQHSSNLYYSQPCADLAEFLCTRTGMSKVFFSNSGAEANECAIKGARKYAADKKGAEYYNIITLKQSFHGRTLTTLAATGQDAFHNDFTPLTEGFVYAEPNSLDSVKELISKHKCAGLMLEVVQGEGGVVALDEAFVRGVAELASQNDLVLICDEVQIGNGRSGMLYGYMNYGICPDIVTTAKGLGGGLPIGATMFSKKLENVLSAGMHGSTFGGNPVACAGAVSIISRIDQKLLDGVKKRSAYIFDALSSAKGVKSVSGLGLMIGIETERDAGEVIADCMERGVLVIKAKNKVRLLPALNIPIKQLTSAIEILKEVCAK